MEQSERSSPAPTQTGAKLDLIDTDRRSRDLTILLPVLVGGSMFMPWATFQGDVGTVTGWASGIGLLNVSIPSWTVLVLAAVAAGLAVLGRGWPSGPPRGLIRALLFLGVAQSAFFFFLIASSDKSTAGIGPIVSVVALVAYLIYGMPARAASTVRTP